MSLITEKVNVSVKADDPFIVTVPNKDSAIPSTPRPNHPGYVPASEVFGEMEDYMEAKAKQKISGPTEVSEPLAANPVKVSPTKDTTEPLVVNPVNVSPARDTDYSSSDEAIIKSDSVPSLEASAYCKCSYGGYNWSQDECP